MSDLCSCKTLSNGVKVPYLGIGTTIRSPEDEPEFINNLVYAIELGYRMIDTAWVYKTENKVGEAISIACNSGLSRSDLFVQTKFYPQMPYGYDEVMAQFEESLTSLGLDYVDAYLFHQPVPRYSELEYKERNANAWRAMARLYDEKLVRVIGVSNFLERHIEYLVTDAEIMPMINQLEINPLFQQRGLSEWCRCHGVMVESWGPLAKGNAIDADSLAAIAEEYNVSTAQLCLRWNIQMGNVPIVSSTKRENIASNLELDFVIPEAGMEAIRLLNTSTEHRETWWYPRQQMY